MHVYMASVSYVHVSVHMVDEVSFEFGVADRTTKPVMATFVWVYMSLSCAAKRRPHSRRWRHHQLLRLASPWMSIRLFSRS